MADDLLFVYGTLRRDTESEMAHLLARYADVVGEGTYRGRLYQVDYYPGVVPSDDPADRVRGEVYSLRNPRIALPQLDRYEGCGPGFREPTEYVRRQEEIVLTGGTACTAWVYVYNRPVDGLVWIRPGDFLGDWGEDAEKEG